MSSIAQHLLCWRWLKQPTHEWNICACTLKLDRFPRLGWNLIGGMPSHKRMRRRLYSLNYQQKALKIGRAPKGTFIFQPPFSSRKRLVSRRVVKLDHFPKKLGCKFQKTLFNGHQEWWEEPTFKVLQCWSLLLGAIVIELQMKNKTHYTKNIPKYKTLNKTGNCLKSIHQDAKLT